MTTDFTGSPGSGDEPDDPSGASPGDLDPGLLDRYWFGGATPAEIEVVERWQAQHPARATWYEQIRHGLTIEGDQAPVTQSDVHRNIASVLSVTTDAIRQQNVVGRRSDEDTRGSTGRFPHLPKLWSRADETRPGLRWRTWPSSLRVVAVLAIGLALGLGGRWMAAYRHTPDAITYAAYATHRGQVTHLTLADGTRLALAPNSRVGIARDYPIHRDVTLLGEAYFEVATHQGAPFLVHTGNVTTRVLGTAFNVEHYADDRDVRVMVTSGKVTVTTPRNSTITLVPHMIGRVTDSTTFVTTIGDVTPYHTWTHGVLEFHNTPVRDVLRIVGRWYDVRFEIADTSIAAHRIDTFLDYTDVRDVITAIETVLNVTATSTSDGRVVTLHPRSQVMQTAPLRRERSNVIPSNTEVGR